jgi:hypothetical protein
MPHPIIANYIIGSVGVKEMKKEFKDAEEMNRPPIFSVNYMNYIMDTYAPETFGYNIYQYTTNETKIKEHMKGILSENAISSIINNKNLSDDTRISASNFDYNALLIKDAPQEVIENCFNIAISTMYNFDNIEDKNARKNADEIITHLIDNKLLNHELEEQLIDICSTDNNPKNKSFNNKYIYSVLSKTTSPNLLSSHKYFDIFNNPNVLPETVDASLKEHINSGLSYKQPGTYNYYKVLNEILKLYSLKTNKNTCIEEQKKLFAFLQNSFRKGLDDQVLWNICNVMAANPCTTIGNGQTIGILDKIEEMSDYGQAKFCSYIASLNKELKKAGIDDKTLFEITSFASSQMDTGTPNLPIETNLITCQILKDFLKLPKFKNIYEKIEKTLTQLDKQRIETEIFEKYENLFIKQNERTYKNNFMNYMINIDILSKKTNQEIRSIFSTLTNEQLDRFNELLFKTFCTPKSKIDSYKNLDTFYNVSGLIKENYKQNQKVAIDENSINNSQKSINNTTEIENNVPNQLEL